jgi:hypothetical protein
MDKAITAIGGTIVTVYLIRVVMSGNARKLLELAKNDWQYLEFLAAIYILYLLHKSDFGGQIVDMLITTAIIGLVIKLAAQSSTDFSGTLSKFMGGHISMTQTVFDLLGIPHPTKEA